MFQQSRQLLAVSLYGSLSAQIIVPNIALSQPSLSEFANESAVNCAVVPYEGSLFPEVYDAAQGASLAFCRTLIDSQFDASSVDSLLIGQNLANFTQVAKQALDDRNLDEVTDYSSQFNEVKDVLSNFNFFDMRMPQLNVARDIDGAAIGGFAGIPDSVPAFEIGENQNCNQISNGLSCYQVFDDFEQAFNPYRSAYDNAYSNTRLINELGRNWDRFLEISKSQTSLEVLLTTIANRNHFKADYLVGPPPFQIIAFHPNLVYESNSNARDGSNEELGLAVEWIGINFWSLNIPLGISITSVYSDREGVKDFGNGLQFHIYNKYALGWAKHGNDDSFYFSLDLLKIFSDKREIYNKYFGHTF